MNVRYSLYLVVDAPNAVSAILNHSKIGGKLNSDALNNLFYEEMNKRKTTEDSETASVAASATGGADSNSQNFGAPEKKIKTNGPVSLLSGLSLKY